MTITSLPYTRALDPANYVHPDFAPYVETVRQLEQRMQQTGAPYRKDHLHREWEYANVLRQLVELHGPEVGDGPGPEEGRLRILDTGFGANFFTPGLASLGYAVTAADSMAYGDCVPWLIEQCQKLGVEVPVIAEPVQAMPSIPDQTFDVTLCISTIEHLPAEDWQAGWDELRRVTKIGGYLMVTTDYFENLKEWVHSPFHGIQHTAVTPEFLSEHLMLNPTLIEIGGTDLTYRGHHVNNYSFVNICLQRRT